MNPQGSPLHRHGPLLFGGSLALVSVWAPIPVGLRVRLQAERKALEDKTLRRKTAGHAEYAGRVLYRSASSAR